MVSHAFTQWRLLETSVLNFPKPPNYAHECRIRRHVYAKESLMNRFSQSMTIVLNVLLAGGVITVMGLSLSSTIA